MSTAVEAIKEPVSREVLAYTRMMDGDVPGKHPYVALLGLRSFDTMRLVKRLEDGLSFSAFERLRDGLDLSAKDLAALIQISARTLARRKDEGRLRPDESDRLVRVARIFGRAIDLFEGDAAAARLWLGKSNTALGGASPLEMVTSEVGAREIVGLIGRLEHGVFS
jgi:putative toxin-antitoxin system antitoxin component (TIGR02293 family)